MATKTTSTTDNNAGCSPCTPEAHQRANIQNQPPMKGKKQIAYMRFHVVHQLRPITGNFDETTFCCTMRDRIDGNDPYIVIRGSKLFLTLSPENWGPCITDLRMWIPFMAQDTEAVVKHGRHAQASLDAGDDADDVVRELKQRIAEESMNPDIYVDGD